MAISRFTEAYDKTKASVKSYKFDPAWHQFLTDKACVRLIMAADDGPNVTYGGGLDKLRTKMAESTGKTDGELLLKMVGVNPTGTQTLTADQAKAVASLKLLRHFYLQDKVGSQSVWIFAQPKSYAKWVFDEIDGKTAAQAKDKLDKIDEVYSKTLRKHMGEGITQAKAWSGKCVSKLGSPDQATKDMVKKWFVPSGGTDETYNKVKTKLLEGFKKISAMLGSNKVIFSDEPLDRNAGGWKDYAFVDTSERLQAVYIQKATLDAWSSASEKWMATLAVVHEISHKVVGTQDASYDDDGGLKPGGIFKAKHTVANADSWAYFAADLNGCLSEARRAACWRTPTSWDSSYDPTTTPNL